MKAARPTMGVTGLLLCLALAGCPSEPGPVGGIELCLLTDPPPGTVVNDQEIRLWEGTAVAFKVDPLDADGEYRPTAVTLSTAAADVLEVHLLQDAGDNCDGPEGSRHFILFGATPGQTTLTLQFRKNPDWVIPVTVMAQ